MTIYSFEQASEFAATALDLMARYKIPPEPINFRVWYAYAAGEDAALKRAIDVLISNRCEFTPERNAEIAEQFFGLEANYGQIAEVGSQLEALAEEILAHVATAKKASESDRATFDSLAEDANAAGSGSELEDTARRLVQTTQAIITRHAKLEQELGQRRTEINGLQNSMLELREKAHTDALTGLANRRRFENDLREAATVSGENGTALSLIMMDVDHFKQFNDRYGHQIGDETLKIVASRLLRNLPDGSSPARYGGEEFITLLTDTELDDAADIAERIRRDLAANTLKNRHTGESYGKITASFGVASYHLGERLDDFVRRTDEALYRAKRDGRDQVAVADADGLLHFGQ